MNHCNPVIARVVFALALIAPWPLLAGGVQTAPAESRPPAVSGEALDVDDSFTTDASDRRELVLTLYQNAPALIRDLRDIGLTDDPLSLRVLDISDRIIAESLRLSGEAPLELLSLRRPEALSRGQLLRAMVGHDVLLQSRETTDGEPEPGRLVALVDGEPLVRRGDILELIDDRSPWRVVFAAEPGLMQRTEALWLDLRGALPGRQGVEFLYQSGGLAWQTDYLLELDGDSIRLQAFARLENRTAMDFSEARIRLLAGDPETGAGTMRREMMASDSMTASAEGPYQLFRLPHAVSLPAGQTLQVPMFAHDAIDVRRQYRLQGRASGRASGEQATPVSLYLNFRSPQDDDASPLPAGTARVYQDDADGEPLFLGQDRLPASPPGRDVSLRLGTAFDLGAWRTQREFRRLGDRQEEQAWTIRLHNAGAEDAVVEVTEQIPGQWTMLDESIEHERRSADRAVWQVELPAGEEKELHYRVEIRH